jgi:hypothetical protein
MSDSREKVSTTERSARREYIELALWAILVGGAWYYAHRCDDLPGCGGMAAPVLRQQSSPPNRDLGSKLEERKPPRTLDVLEVREAQGDRRIGLPPHGAKMVPEERSRVA